jgi:hypothetical protein
MSTLKDLNCLKYSFQIVTQLSHRINVLHAAASNLDGFLLEIHVFLQFTWLCVLGTKWANPPLENVSCRKSFFDKLTKFSQGNNARIFLLPTEMVFFGEIYVFLQMCWIGLLGTKCAYLYIENPQLPEVLLSSTNSDLTEKQCATCCSF